MPKGFGRPQPEPAYSKKVRTYLKKEKANRPGDTKIRDLGEQNQRINTGLMDMGLERRIGGWSGISNKIKGRVKK